MQTEIVVLKNTKNGIEVDTVYSSNDTLYVETTIEIPSKPIEVNTHPPEKSDLEIFVSWASIIGGIAGFIAVGIAIYKLFQKDKDKQEQLNKMTGLVGALEAQNELIKEGNDNTKNYLIELSRINSEQSDTSSNDRLVQLEEQRLRLMVKPRIWINGGGFNGSTRALHISIENSGEICFLDSITQVPGEEWDRLILREWSTPLPIEKNGGLRVRATLFDPNTHPREANFRIHLNYHDQGDYNYISVVEWAQGRVQLIETNELPRHD